MLPLNLEWSGQSSFTVTGAQDISYSTLSGVQSIGRCCEELKRLSWFQEAMSQPKQLRHISWDPLDENMRSQARMPIFYPEHLWTQVPIEMELPAVSFRHTRLSRYMYMKNGMCIYTVYNVHITHDILYFPLSSLLHASYKLGGRSMNFVGKQWNGTVWNHMKPYETTLMQLSSTFTNFPSCDLKAVESVLSSLLHQSSKVAHLFLHRQIKSRSSNNDVSTWKYPCKTLFFQFSHQFINRKVKRSNATTALGKKLSCLICCNPFVCARPEKHQEF